MQNGREVELEINYVNKTERVNIKYVHIHVYIYMHTLAHFLSTDI